MCRALLYLGRPAPLDWLLLEPDNSLVRQALTPQMLHMLNIAGFGVMAWDPASRAPEQPFRYSSTSVAPFDRNLKALAGKVAASCALAHVRGVAYTADVAISHENTHPFCFPGARIALAHNGDLHRIREMRPALLRHIRPQLARLIAGSTDSEWIYALLLSQLGDPFGLSDGPELREAVSRTLAILREVRRELGIDASSSVNLFIANGRLAMAARYCFDFGRYRTEDPAQVHEANLSYLSLWYTQGREFGLHDGEWKMIGGEDSADSLIVASEPLTRDATTWLEVPEYSLLCAEAGPGGPRLTLQPLRV
jgi:glutamine amidotransferase